MISALKYRIICGSFCGNFRNPRTRNTPPGSPNSAPWVLLLCLSLLNFHCKLSPTHPNFSHSVHSAMPDVTHVTNFTSPYYTAEPAQACNLDLLQLRKLSAILNKLSHIKYGNHNLKIFAWNLGSAELWRKIPVIEAFIAETHPDVIGFPESNQHQDRRDVTPHINAS